MAKKKYYKRADGLYETSRTVKGRRVYFRGKTCAEIDRKILAYNAEKKRGRKVPVIADEWYKLHEKDIRNGTYRVYGYALERVKAAFPQSAGEVTPLDIKRYLTAFEQKGYAGNTVHIELAVIKQIFSHAVMQGDIDTSPATEVKPGRNLPCKTRHALTEEDERKVEAYRGENWLLGVMLLYTGCRRGELLALHWQDIDRKAGTITINKKLDYSWGNTPHLDHYLKNENSENCDGSGRTIPLFTPLAEVLPKGRIGYIFADENGNPLTASRFYRVWKKYRSAVGLAAEVTPHCFRHSFATICYESGLDVKTAAAFLGDTEAITTGVYTELRARKHVSGAERVNAYLEMRSAEQTEAK